MSRPPSPPHPDSNISHPDALPKLRLVMAASCETCRFHSFEASLLPIPASALLLCKTSYLPMSLQPVLLYCKYNRAACVSSEKLISGLHCYALCVPLRKSVVSVLCWCPHDFLQAHAREVVRRRQRRFESDMGLQALLPDLPTPS